MAMRLETSMTRALPTATRRLVRNPACRPRTSRSSPTSPPASAAISKPTNASSGQPRRCIVSVMSWSRPFIGLAKWWGVIRSGRRADNCAAPARHNVCTAGYWQQRPNDPDRNGNPARRRPAPPRLTRRLPRAGDGPDGVRGAAPGGDRRAHGIPRQPVLAVPRPSHRARRLGRLLALGPDPAVVHVHGRRLAAVLDRGPAGARADVRPDVRPRPVAVAAADLPRHLPPLGQSADAQLHL